MSLSTSTGTYARRSSSDLDARVYARISDAPSASETATCGPNQTVDYVLLAGQATKLPSLKAAITARIPVPVVDVYQDDAVIRALPVQAGCSRPGQGHSPDRHDRRRNRTHADT